MRFSCLTASNVPWRCMSSAEPVSTHTSFVQTCARRERQFARGTPERLTSRPSATAPTVFSRAVRV
jgi:hypothetical protein